MKGTRLKPLILEPEVWFAWSEFHPQTLLYGWESARYPLTHSAGAICVPPFERAK